MTGAQPDPPRTRCGQMARRRMPAGRHTHGRPAMPRLTAIAACRPRRVAIVHFSTPFWSLACCGDRLDTMPALRRSPDDGPCRPDAAASPRPTRIPADLRGPARQRSLPDRTRGASSTFARPSLQGAGQRRARPCAQGCARHGARRASLACAEGCGSETSTGRRAPRVQRARVVRQGGQPVRAHLARAFAARFMRRRSERAPVPAGNVSSALHARGGPPLRRPAAAPAPFSRRGNDRRRPAASRPYRRSRRDRRRCRDR